MLFASTRVEDLPKDKIHPSCCKFHHIHRYHMDKKRNSSHSKPRKYLKFSSNIAVVCIHMVSGRLYISTISHFFSIASEISIIRSYPLDSSPIFLVSLCIPSYSLHMIHPPTSSSDLRPCHREGNGGIYRTIQHQFQPNEGGDRSKQTDLELRRWTKPPKKIWKKNMMAADVV